MKRKTKKIIKNITMVLLNILVVVGLLLVLVFKNNYGYSLYYTFIPFLIVVIISIIQRWSSRGLNADTEESKVIQRSFDDTTTLSTVFFALIYLTIQGLECWKENITHQPIVIICFFFAIVIYELFTYLAIYNAKKETAKLVEKKYNKKK